MTPMYPRQANSFAGTYSRYVGVDLEWRWSSRNTTMSACERANHPKTHTSKRDHTRGMLLALLAFMFSNGKSSVKYCMHVGSSYVEAHFRSRRTNVTRCMTPHHSYSIVCFRNAKTYDFAKSRPSAVHLCIHRDPSYGDDPIS